MIALNLKRFDWNKYHEENESVSTGFSVFLLKFQSFPVETLLFLQTQKIDFLNQSNTFRFKMKI